MMRVLVAGASGTLGRPLVEELLAQGHDVVALARHPQRLGELRARVAATHRADLTRETSLRNVCDGVDVVISTVGLVGKSALTSRASHERVDHQGNLHLLREAQRAGVRRFVYVSAHRADEAHSVPLLAAKAAFEGDLKESGLDWLIVRPTAFFDQIAEGVLDQARRGVVFFVGDGLARVAPLAAEDAAAWMARNLDRSRETVTLAGPDKFTYNGIAELCFQLLGRPSRVVHLPPRVADATIGLARPLPGALHGELSFLRFVMTHDLVAPPTGKRKLRSFLEDAATRAE